MIWRIVAVLLWALAPAVPVQAHETTRSYLALERDGAKVTAELRLAFRDIEVVAWMDEDLDGRITWAEALRRMDAATAYAAARIVLEAGGPCRLEPEGTGASESAGIGYLDLRFQAVCPGPVAPLRVSSTLFADIDPSHRLFLTGATATGTASAVLDNSGSPVALAFDAPDRWGSLAAFFVAGVDHLMAGADHLVFLLVLILPFVAAMRHAPRRAILSVLAAITGFTLAHALTLTAAATDLLRPPGALIEGLVALSILLTAIDNVRPFLPGSRATVAAFLGTIHGFGFATALSGRTGDGADFVVALIGFNAGIEAAQIAVVAVAMPALAMLGGGARLVWCGSILAGGLSVWWIWERLPGIISLF